MAYFITMLFPFLGPFFRDQPFKGISETVGTVIFVPIIAIIFWPILIMLVLGWLPWGMSECHAIYNYRRYGFWAEDIL